MGVQLVQVALREERGVEDSRTAVHKVVVKRRDHERGLGHHAPDVGRVERPVAGDDVGGYGRHQGVQDL